MLARAKRASRASPAPVLLRAAIKAEPGLGPITTDELKDTTAAMSPGAAAAFMAREPTEELAAQDTDNDEADNEAYDDAEAGMD